MLIKLLHLSQLALTSLCRSLLPSGALPALRRLRWASIMALIMALVMGCSDAGPQLAPVTGRVFLDGEAVADAGVLFTPTHKGPSASASTNAEGWFRLQTGSADGALVGNHRVVISKAETHGISADAEGLSGAVSDGGWQFIEHLPARYSRPNTSGLTADVVANTENEITFELTETDDEKK